MDHFVRCYASWGAKNAAIRQTEYTEMRLKMVLIFLRLGNRNALRPADDNKPCCTYDVRLSTIDGFGWWTDKIFFGTSF